MKTKAVLPGVSTLVFLAAFAPLAGLLAQTDPTANRPPIIRITNPQTGQAYLAPADIQLFADARDADGFVRRVEFFANETRIGVVEPDPAGVGPMTPFHVRWSQVPPGAYDLTAKATDNEEATTPSETVKILVLEAPVELPIVTIVTVDPTAMEQSPLLDSIPDTAKVVVRRTGSTDEELEVLYHVGGTATPEADYEKLPGTVTIPAGSTEAEIVITAVDDEAVEPEETVVLSLWALLADPNSPFPYRVGRPAEARVLILDNEPHPNLPPRVAIITPPNGAIFVSPPQVLIVASATDTDGWVKSVEFFADGESLGVVSRDPALGPVPLNDSHPEWGPIAPFSVVWLKPTPGEHKLTAVATDDQGAQTTSEVVQIRILEVPIQPVVTVVATDAEGAEAAPGPDGVVAPDPAVFTIRRTGATDAPLEVQFRLGGTAQNGVDYTEVPLLATIPEGAESVDVVIKPIDDTLAEGTEKVELTLVPPACIEIFPPPADCYLVGRMHTAGAVILDNEEPANLPPLVDITHPHDGELFLAGSDIRLMAMAWDRDGTVKSVEFFEGENSLGMAEHDPARDGLFVLSWLDVPVGDYALTAVATDDDGATRTSRPVEIKVVRIQLPPIVTVEASDAEAAETLENSEQPSNPAAFEVHRTGPVDEALTVYFRLGGSAENGVDYAGVPLKVVIPVNAEAAEVGIEPIDDLLAEGPETVVLQLVPGICVTDPVALVRPGYIVGVPSSARAVILDNDADANLPPRVAITQPENGAVFKAPATINVKVAVRDPDGYVPRVELYAGDQKIGEQEVNFIVAPPPGQDQTFTFEWKDVMAGAYRLRAKAFDNGGADAWSGPVGIVVVPVDRPAVVTVVALDPLAIEPGADASPNTATFVIHRRGDLSLALKVFYAVGGTAENGVDYEKLVGEVTLPEGHDAARVVVNPLADDLVEGTESVVIELLEPGCIAIEPPPPDCYRLGELRRAEAQILDRDALPNRPPHIEIVRPHPGEVFQAPADVKIVAMVADSDGRVVKVEFFADGNKIGELPAPQPEVAPMDVERRGVTFLWENAPVGRHVLTAVATDDDGATGLSHEVPISVIESSRPPQVWIVATDPYAAERSDTATPNTATFRVRRTGAVNLDLAVLYSLHGTAENGKDYKELTGSVTIPAGQRSARIVIEPINDTEQERIETVIAKLEPSPAASPIAPYEVGWPDKACAVIVDNDMPMDAVRPLPDDVIHLCLPGENGLPYRVEASEDLVDWIPVADVLAEAGQVQFAQPAMHETRHRFFRVRPIVIEALGLGE